MSITRLQPVEPCDSNRLQHVDMNGKFMAVVPRRGGMKTRIILGLC